MIQKIPQYFLRPFPHMEKFEIIRKVIYWFLLINTLMLLPGAFELFGYNGIIGTRGWNTDKEWYEQASFAFLNILSHPANSSYTWLYQLFLGGQILFLVLGILNKFPRIASVMVYFFTINLFHKGYLAFTGGEVLLNILLFYMLFIHRLPEKDPLYRLQNLLNNTFFLIILIQICVVYFFSTLYKFLDPDWVSGNALMYISSIEGYTSGMLKLLFEENPTVSWIGTWFALIYQISFPLLVWVKKIKVPFLIIGAVFHLMISFGMGIFSFGVIMIILYLFFLDLDQIKWIERKLKFWKKNQKVTTA